MKTTKNSFKSPAQAIAASKLVVASSALHADFTDGSKANQLSISQGETVYWVVNPDGSGNGNQIATPLLEIIQDDSNKIMPKGEDSRGQSKSETVIYPGAVNLDLFNGTAGEYIEEKFFVSLLNGKNNGPLDVYLVISPNQSDGTEWKDTAAGFILIDGDNFEVIGKATVEVIESETYANSLVSEDLGFYVLTSESGLYPTIQFNIPIERKNFDLPFFSTETMYMQAIAFPEGTLDWANAVVSPLYTFSLTSSNVKGSNK
ncbi:MAG: hypothetical protein H6936_00410 [Burkholderiales bacterium]|nr:hypothetical protein [Nitrosomonas sp.]MCP5273317.1 hypothetical protein [Burkholderiales bacterium]